MWPRISACACPDLFEIVGFRIPGVRKGVESNVNGRVKHFKPSRSNRNDFFIFLMFLANQIARFLDEQYTQLTFTCSK